MINGTDIVKEAADVITTNDNDHDGLCEFILGAINS
jgi:hydroxymethylpyrimidine pyrophosphatase-like HAD family hydrolase